ncbi:hypothetical protein BL250_00585 [Erwinia sp. OLTSP20]|uniref:hypothetical protein n=1 Tax=unclassified Erwinia TaxID=2622719 RepID=UPI000C1A2A66|nr:MULTISPECIES: hypothetical protein [unclassified Erwinia]PIJ52147.1 hypothetical protein BV501_00885 [Erwinia sp. OAMSP11]PIJ73108.1 hypothetical protein BK416_07550 [Erwinia sp. OLSSP12]PIJ84676.1 hypothetical protein BLD47_01705 [Erwinia sp. OLCASP19]PIJ87323.1 hypothetical protein BLD46_00850 [Erwinia sp. OLMTSP26]PIJ87522.1 hypothetical protein BLD49_05825 [Erwinia sp. OLMDSP33]
MKLYHIDKAREYRRIMLDVLEVCPRRFRDDILRDMAYIREDGDLMAEYFRDLHCGELQFFYRLRNSRSFRRATLHQSSLLLSILDRLEEAYRYDTGQAFMFQTAEERQTRRKASRGSIQRQIEWSQKHPRLSKLSFLLHCTPLLTVLSPVIFIVIAVTFFVFIGRHPILFFWH